MLEFLQDPMVANWSHTVLNVCASALVAWRAGRNKHERTLLTASMKRIDQVECRNEQLGKELLKEATARARVEQQLEDVQRTLAEKQRESEQLRKDLEHAKRTHSTDIAALQARQDAQEEEIAALQAERDQLAEHVRALSEQVTQLGQTPAPAPPPREYPRAANGQFAPRKKGRSK